jgi:hypothetical protein
MSTYINRGRDVFNMMQVGGEQGMKKAIVKLAEDNAQLNDRLKDYEAVLEKCVEAVTRNQLVNVKLVREYEKIKKKFYPDNEGNPDAESDFVV